MEKPTELKAIRIINFQNICSTLFFIDIINNIYQLKDYQKHWKLANFGNSKNIHITEDDLINMGPLNKIKDYKNLIILDLN